MPSTCDRHAKAATAKRASRAKDIEDEASLFGTTKAGIDIPEHKEMPPDIDNMLTPREAAEQVW